MSRSGRSRVLLSRSCGALATLFAASLLAPPARAQDWRQDQLLIGGWGTTRFGDAAMYQRLSDAGIDLVVPADSFHLAPLDSALLAARTVQGLRDADPSFRLRLLSHVLNVNPRPGDIQGNADPARNAAALRATLDTLGRYSAVAGYWVWDEPADPEAVGRAFALARFVGRESPGRLPYVNLFPSYIGDPRQQGELPDRWRRHYGANKRQGYPAYLDDWLRRWAGEPAPAPLLSFDHYVYEPTVFVWDDYLLSLEAARDKAAEWSRPGQRIPLWVYVQLSGNRERRMVPSEAQVRLQVYSALAHGARGIMYWTLAPSHAGPGYAPALLDDRGRPAARYDAIARLNAEVHALGPTLMRLDPVAVSYSALGGQVGIEDDLFTSPERVYSLVKGEARADSACMVAHLKDREDGTHHLLVVNRDLARARSFSVRLGARADSVQRVRREDGVRVAVGTALETLEVRDLPPGTGELFRVVDGVYEHIPDVAAIAVDGSRVYYGHRRGVVGVDEATGERWVYRDGTVFTPVVDLAVFGDTVLIVQNSGPNGSLIRTDRRLRGADVFYVTRPQFFPITSVDVSADGVVAGENPAGGPGRVAVLTRQGGLVGHCDLDGPVTDVAWDGGRGTFRALIGATVHRQRAGSPFQRIDSAPADGPTLTPEAERPPAGMRAGAAGGRWIYAADARGVRRLPRP